MYMCVCIYIYICIHMYMYLAKHPDAASVTRIMKTGWSPWEGHPCYSVSIIILVSDSKH